MVMTKVCWGLSADPLGAGRVSLEAVWGGFSYLSVCGLPTAWQSGNQTLTRGPPEQRASGQETLRSHPQAEEVGGRTGPGRCAEPVCSRIAVLLALPFTEFLHFSASTSPSVEGA